METEWQAWDIWLLYKLKASCHKTFFSSPLRVSGRWGPEENLNARCLFHYSHLRNLLAFTGQFFKKKHQFCNHRLLCGFLEGYIASSTEKTDMSLLQWLLRLKKNLNYWRKIRDMSLAVSIGPRSWLSWESACSAGLRTWAQTPAPTRAQHSGPRDGETGWSEELSDHTVWPSWWVSGSPRDPSTLGGEQLKKTHPALNPGLHSCSHIHVHMYVHV